MNPCKSNHCNDAISECISDGYGDYTCDCKNGFIPTEGTDGKECEGKNNYPIH